MKKQQAKIYSEVAHGMIVTKRAPALAPNRLSPNTTLTSSNFYRFRAANALFETRQRYVGEVFLMTQCSVPESSVEILLSGFEHAGLS